MSAPAVVDPQDTLAVLRAARLWLNDPRHFTQGTYWRNRYGHRVARRESVAKTCGLGALGYVTGDGYVGPRAAAQLLRAWLWDDSGRCNVVLANDMTPRSTARACVLTAYDRAIATLEAEGP